jgi:hypothetical protein
MSDTLKDLVEFLHDKFRTTEGPSKWYDGHDIYWGDSLLYHGCPDTEGYGSSAIDYTELLKRIDEFAAEFAAGKPMGSDASKVT